MAGIEQVGGNMFESVTNGADAIFVKMILHDWSDERSLNLLKNCRKALPENDKVIIAELILPVALETSTTTKHCPNTYKETSTAAKYKFHLDMIMFADCPGGKERTEKEF